MYMGKNNMINVLYSRSVLSIMVVIIIAVRGLTPGSGHRSYSQGYYDSCPNDFAESKHNSFRSIPLGAAVITQTLFVPSLSNGGNVT